MTLFINSDSTKGGDGKTMVATTLASYLTTERNLDVGLIDLDEQKTATSLFEAQKHYGIEQHFTIVEEGQDTSKFDVVIVDHPPNLNRQPIGSFVISPIKPSKNSILSFNKYESTLDNKKIFVYKLLNQVRDLPSHREILTSPEFKYNKHLSKIQVYENMENENKTIFHKPSKTYFGLNNARKEFKVMFEFALKQYIESDVMSKIKNTEDETV
jgi:cellulose biosynthesis protein BcsQ